MKCLQELVACLEVHSGGPPLPADDCSGTQRCVSDIKRHTHLLIGNSGMTGTCMTDFYSQSVMQAGHLPVGDLPREIEPSSLMPIDSEVMFNMV